MLAIEERCAVVVGVIAFRERSAWSRAEITAAIGLCEGSRRDLWWLAVSDCEKAAR